MKRNPNALIGEKFDIVVVGGGIHGICVARDAAMRGYSVALLERGDFGCATSHNSLKLVHGGMRYIQHLDFRRMRQSVRERRAWLRIAPHLVQPLKFAMHTYGHTTRGPLALWLATRIHETIGFDRNSGVKPERHIPRGYVTGQRKAGQLCDELEDDRANGVAYWYDGHMQNADRIMTECLESAVIEGATVVNYHNVAGLLKSAGKVYGVAATDLLTGHDVEVFGDVTINAAGPWVDQLSYSDGERKGYPVERQPLNFNMNLVTRRVVDDCALGMKSARPSDSRVDNAGRLFFLTPWRDVSVIGTTHESYQGNPDDCFASQAAIESFIEEVNASFRPARLTLDDVKYCYWGLTPGEDGLSGGEARRARHGQVIDHARRDTIDGLISIIGVKWTTARLVAKTAVDMAARSIKKPRRVCRTDVSFLPGAQDNGDMLTSAGNIRSKLAPDAVASAADQIASEYGSRWADVLDCADVASGAIDDAIFRMGARYAVKEEMAVRLTDVLARRTSLLQRGKLTESQLAWSLDMMANELNWPDERRLTELKEFRKYCASMHAKMISDLAPEESVHI